MIRSCMHYLSVNNGFPAVVKSAVHNINMTSIIEFISLKLTANGSLNLMYAAWLSHMLE